MYADFGQTTDTVILQPQPAR